MNRRRHAPLEPPQAQLKKTQFAGRTWVDLAPRGVAIGEHRLTQFMTPERGDRHCQQQAFEAVGMLQARVLQIEAARLSSRKLFSVLIRRPYSPKRARP